MKRLFSLLGGTALAMSLAVAGAQAPQSGGIAVEQNRMVEPIVPAPDEKIDDWSERFLQKMGLSEFGEHHGKYFYYAQMPVMLPQTDPQYANALINAYDKAMFNIYEQFAMDMYGKVLQEQTREFFQNSSTDADKLEAPTANVRGMVGKVLALMDKSLDVADKELDKKLAELGVDPAQYRKLTPRQKKDLFKERFLKKTIKKASGDISGLFTVQSAVAVDKSGNAVVGVIAVVSPKTRQIAKDIRLQRRSLIAGKGRDIRSLIPQKPDALFSTLGTRLVYDSDGTPAIISYGMHSYMPQKDHYLNVRLKQNAKDAAVAVADGQIAMLVNGFLSARFERQRGEEVNRYIERELKPDAMSVEKTVRNVIDKTYQRAKASASMRLQGVSTFKTWRYTLPAGQKVVGAVRVWRYATLDAVRRFKEGYKPKPKSRPKGKSSFGESEIVNDINDF